MEWSRCESEGGSDGEQLQLDNLKTARSKKKEKYTLFLKAIDSLGAFTTKKQDLDSLKPLLPPVITSVSVPSEE